MGFLSSYYSALKLDLKAKFYNFVLHKLTRWRNSILDRMGI